ncbi:MAG: OmpW family outer membrane protein [Pseudomonadota bacterium]
MIKTLKLLAGSAVALSLVGGAAQAADILTPVTPSEPVFEEPRSPWMFRLRGIGVIPDEGADLTLNGVDVVGGDVSIDDTFVPEFDITYFFTENFAAELILATTPHTISGAGTAAGFGELTDVWLLPPTLLAQFHLPIGPHFKPYVGAGINYTFFYNIDEAPGLNIDIDDSFGFALQAGVDIMINEHWGINFDVKKLFLETDATITGPGINIQADVDIDPWIVGGGVVYRF